jgi:hypothetical protein
LLINVHNNTLLREISGSTRVEGGSHAADGILDAQFVTFFIFRCDRK